MYSVPSNLPSPPAERIPQAAYSLLEPAEILGLFRRRKMMIGLAALLGVGLAVAYFAYIPRRYTSETQIVIDPRGLQVIGQEVTPSGQTSDVNAALIETYMRVLTSDRVLRQVVAREGLDRDPEFNGEERTLAQETRLRLRALLAWPERPADPAEVQALRALQQRVRAQKPERGYVIDLKVTTKDPEKSARLARAVASAYVDEEAEARRELARRAGQDLSGRLGDLAARVNQAENAVEAYKLSNNLVGASGQLITDQELTALNAQLVAAQGRTAELRSRADQIQRLARSGRIPDTIAETVQSATIGSIRVQFSELNRLEADLATRLGPRHPDTVSIRAQVQRVRGQINDELDRIARAARSDYDRARTNEEALAGKLSALKKDALNVSQSLVRLRELEREAQASRSIYETFLGRTREIGEQQRLDTGNARVISPALAPEKANGPSAAVIALLGAALGATSGALLAFLTDKLGGRVQSSRQLSAFTSLPLIGELPRPRRLRAPRNRDKLATMPLARLLDGATAQIGGCVYDAVFSRSRPGSATRIVTVTSPDDARSRTAIALALALEGASRGLRTLLMDGDSSSRELTRALGPGAGGLDDVLSGRVTLAEAATIDPHSGLTKLLAGSGRTWPAKRPSLGAVRALIEGDVAEFDLVVIDADLAGHTGAARAFAEVASDIVLVARAGVTRLRAIEEACVSLGPHAVNLAGMVLVLPAGARARCLRRVSAPWFRTELA